MSNNANAVNNAVVASTGNAAVPAVPAVVVPEFDFSQDRELALALPAQVGNMFGVTTRVNGHEIALFVQYTGLAAVMGKKAPKIDKDALVHIKSQRKVFIERRLEALAGFWLSPDYDAVMAQLAWRPTVRQDGDTVIPGESVNVDPFTFWRDSAANWIHVKQSKQGNNLYNGFIAWLQLQPRAALLASLEPDTFGSAIQREVNKAAKAVSDAKIAAKAKGEDTDDKATQTSTDSDLQSLVRDDMAPAQVEAVNMAASLAIMLSESTGRPDDWYSLAVTAMREVFTVLKD